MTEDVIDHPRPPAEDQDDAGDPGPPTRSVSAWQTYLADPRYRQILLGLAVIALLGQMLFAMVESAGHENGVYDEPIYVGAGVTYVTEHDLTWNPEHPPLTKLLIGWSVIATGTTLDTTSPDYATARTFQNLGAHLLYGPGNDGHEVLAAARLPMILLTLLFGLVLYRFAFDLFGPTPALISLALYTLAPEIIAHGHLAVNDVATGGFFLTSAWCAYRARGRPVPWTIGAGVAYGLSISSKFSALGYLPAAVALVAVSAWSAGSSAVWPDRLRSLATRPRWQRAAGASLVAGVAALATVWLVYFVADPSMSFAGDPRNIAEQASGIQASIVDLLPAPAAFKNGLRFQLVANTLPRSGFLRGESYTGGRLLFHPTLLLIKYPIATIALWVAGIFVILRQKRAIALLYTLVPAASVLSVGMLSQTNIGNRYIIGAPMLLMIIGGAPGLLLDSNRPRVPRKSAAIGVGAALTLTAVSSVLAFPYHLSYANELWGGSANAYELMSDSDVDWGQDLERAGAWIRADGGTAPVCLVYFGSALPSALRVRATLVKPTEVAQITGGTTVLVSVTEYNTTRKAYKDLGPVTDQIGHSILVFRPPRGQTPPRCANPPAG